MDELLRGRPPAVLRRCARFLPYRQDAEEAAQDALLTIATQLDDFAGRGSFLGWVTVIASNAGAADLPHDQAPLRRARGRRAAEQPRSAHHERHRRQPARPARRDRGPASATHPAAVEAFVLRDLGSLPYDDIAELTADPGRHGQGTHPHRARIRP